MAISPTSRFIVTREGLVPFREWQIRQGKLIEIAPIPPVDPVQEEISRILGYTDGISAILYPEDSLLWRLIRM